MSTSKINSLVADLAGFEISEEYGEEPRAEVGKETKEKSSPEVLEEHGQAPEPGKVEDNKEEPKDSNSVGVKVLRKVPASAWCLEEDTGETCVMRANKKKAMNDWIFFLGCKGAKYIEYLIVPSLHLPNEVLSKVKPIGTGLVQHLPKMKAMLLVQEDPDHEDTEVIRGGMICLTNKYSSGSHELVELATVLDTFYKVGDRAVKDLLRHRTYIVPASQLPVTPPPPLKERWKYTAATNRHIRSTLNTIRPRAIIILAENGPFDDSVLTDAFLDWAYWVGSEPPSSMVGSYAEGGSFARWERNISARGLLDTQMLKIVKAAQKVSVHHPSILFPYWVFESASMHVTPANVSNLNSIVATIRGTYLRAAQKLDKRVLGKASVMWHNYPDEIPNIWTIGMFPPVTTHLTTYRSSPISVGTPPVVWCRDKW